MLDRTFEEQKQFLSDASHELRTPLTIAKGNLEVLKKLSNGQNRETADMVDVSLEEINRMGRLVEGLFVLARSAHTNFLAKEEIDLSVFLKQLFAKAQRLGSRNWVLGRLPACRLEGDRDKLTQALLNLFQNAVNHTKEEDEIRLTVGLDGDRVHIHIRDAGPGIAASEHGKIFRRFYQVDKTGSKVRGSLSNSGLGLSIVAAVVAAHGGKVYVDSEEGKGSTFTISLPMKTGAKEA